MERESLEVSTRNFEISWWKWKHRARELCILEWKWTMRGHSRHWGREFWRGKRKISFLAIYSARLHLAEISSMLSQIRRGDAWRAFSGNGSLTTEVVDLGEMPRATSRDCNRMGIWGGGTCQQKQSLFEAWVALCDFFLFLFCTTTRLMENILTGWDILQKAEKCTRKQQRLQARIFTNRPGEGCASMALRNVGRASHRRDRCMQ